MTTFTHQPTISLTIERCCFCGTFWAIEQGFRGKCPRCARKSIDEAHEQLEARTRQLNAQKAATARAAKGRKR